VHKDNPPAADFFPNGNGKSGFGAKPSALPVNIRAAGSKREPRQIITLANAIEG